MKFSYRSRSAFIRFMRVSNRENAFELLSAPKLTVEG